MANLKRYNEIEFNLRKSLGEISEKTIEYSLNNQGFENLSKFMHVF